MMLVFLSALLTKLQIYDRIAQHGGGGTLVPITGFANAVISPALDSNFSDQISFYTEFCGVLKEEGV